MILRQRKRLPMTSVSVWPSQRLSRLGSTLEARMWQSVCVTRLMHCLIRIGGIMSSSSTHHSFSSCITASERISTKYLCDASHIQFGRMWCLNFKIFRMWWYVSSNVMLYKFSNLSNHFFLWCFNFNIRKMWLKRKMWWMSYSSKHHIRQIELRTITFDKWSFKTSHLK